MPCMRTPLFKYGLELVSHRTAVVHGHGEINIQLRYPENKPCVAFSFNMQVRLVSYHNCVSDCATPHQD
ncbi:hypothetical protein DPMN_125577 [Dreissena polymorpha]|uniref:KY-like immunoglobulin-like domain-containing protein n=1 Tax=Dreissena polymorpha TaxID=45954 RepID=A0A9D4GU82_DREPO|nr:hypothetical protein DPMN_125577 [Dreissena polymorpha]